jgi:hypothetical protein
VITRELRPEYTDPDVGCHFWVIRPVTLVSRSTVLYCKPIGGVEDAPSWSKTLIFWGFSRVWVRARGVL